MINLDKNGNFPGNPNDLKDKYGESIAFFANMGIIYVSALAAGIKYDPDSDQKLYRLTLSDIQKTYCDYADKSINATIYNRMSLIPTTLTVTQTFFVVPTRFNNSTTSVITEWKVVDGKDNTMISQETINGADYSQKAEDAKKIYNITLHPN